MKEKARLISIFLAAALLFSGCAMTTVDEMYAIPKRSAEYNDLQRAIDATMTGLVYCAPLSGENQQTVQMADLDGDGAEEYLLFAKGSSENPLQILIYTRSEESCQLRQVIESTGSAFETVEYVDMDGQPGLELVVGRQVSDQVLRSLSVYRFRDGAAAELMSTGYSKFVTSDLNRDGRSELMVIAPGAAESDKGSAALYHWGEDGITRSKEVNLSETADHIKRIMVGNLQSGEPAVYVASSVEESAIITDVFAMKDGAFSNVSLSNESGTSVQTLRNYYVYADDIDHDGVLELPSLITMVPFEGRSAAMQYLIRWYAMELSGDEVDKMYTYHNLENGWFLELDAQWAYRVTVSREQGVYEFRIWNAEFERSEKLMTIYELTGADRESAAMADGRFLLHRAEGKLYAAKLEGAAIELGLSPQSLTNCFHLIFKEWKTGET